MLVYNPAKDYERLEQQREEANLEIENAPLQAGTLFRQPKHQSVTTAHPPNQDSLPIPVESKNIKEERKSM